MLINKMLINTVNAGVFDDKFISELVNYFVYDTLNSLKSDCVLLH